MRRLGPDVKGFRGRSDDDGTVVLDGGADDTAPTRELLTA